MSTENEMTCRFFRKWFRKRQTPDVRWPYIKIETWHKVKGLKRNCWSFSTHFSSTFPSISVHGQLPTPTPAAALKQHSRRTAVSLCLCLTPHHLCFPDPKPAYGLVKRGWRRIRRPLLTSARRVPIDRSITSECRSLHPGYFKHIVQPTANHGPRQAREAPECPSPLRGCCINSGCPLRSEER